MEKEFKVIISLDDKASFETNNGKDNITSEVFDYLVEATKEALIEIVSLDNDDFSNAILENYNQTLPENFKGLGKVGMKIKII